VKLGWSPGELRMKLEFPPSARTIKRIEDGYAVRLPTVHKIFNAIAAAYHEPLKRDHEIIDNSD